MPEGTQPTLEPNVEPIEIQEEVERSFLEYAMSVITSRALPDARDGLKPVHRRIIYGMHDRGLRPDRQRAKSAQVVGHVMGNFHPHGDQSIYDALARMAQDFSLRHPLVDGKGNFGSPDPNDRPGAMRYCVTGDTRIATEYGTPLIREIAEVLPNSTVEIDLKVADREGAPVRATALFHSGEHPTLRVRTREGYEITGTQNHPVLCLENIAGVPMLQWRLLEEMVPGTVVVISRAARSDNLTATNSEVQLALAAGQRWEQTCVPEFVWQAPLGAKQAFLQGLFEGDGSCSALGRNTIQISYSTFSDQLAHDLQVLLLEFGVISRQVRHANGETKVVIGNRRDAARFSQDIGFWGAKQSKLTAILDTLPAGPSQRTTDRVPFMAAYVRLESGTRGPDKKWLEKHDISALDRWGRDFGREIFAHIPNDEVKRVITPLVTNAWYYAEVQSIEEAGMQPVYSIRVDSDDHAFLANGFVNHNTECRLAPIAMQILEGIDENTVDFTDTYDGKTQEPVVLPSRFPNLLVNGGGGIAVGMATNIPPHNLGEVVDATVHLIDNPDATIEDLMGIVQGPDFPSGALILGRSGIQDAARTGRGSIKMRAIAEIEEFKNGQRIVVTEVPYQTSVEVIGSKIAELVGDRKIEGIRDVRNETSRGEYRLVVDLKRDANAQVVLNQLYKHTTMQTSFGVIMLALVDGAPKVLNLKQALQHYIAHQVDVITRRTQFRLDKAAARSHILEGLLRALESIHDIIALIENSESADAARTQLMAKPYEFSEIQANHILDMQLRRLAHLEHQKMRDEFAELANEMKDLNAILGSREKLEGVIKTEIGEVREKFANERRTQITFDSGDIDVLDLIEDEEVVMVLSKKGYVKTVASDAFRKQGRGGRGVRGSSLKDEDYVEHLLTTTAHSYLLFFSNRGRVYRLRAHEIPMKERTARGTALVNLIALAPEEHIQAVIDTRTYEDGAYLFFATKRGQVKKTKMGEYDSSLRTGLIAINLKPGDELVRVIQTIGDGDIFMVSRNGMTIRFTETDVRSMGRAAAGVRGMKLKNADDAVVSVDVAKDDSVMLFVSESGHGKRTKLDRFNSQRRGGQGVRGMKITASRQGVVAAFTVQPDDEVLVFSSAGNIIRTGVKDISSQGRVATGVKVAALAAGDSVVAVAPVLEADEGEDA